MSKPNWLLAYEYECEVERIVLNANEQKRTVFVIDIPGVEGNSHLFVSPRDLCDHEWRFLDIDAYKDAVGFECQWCDKTKYVKINYETKVYNTSK
jgi:hypothetical protein